MLDRKHRDMLPDFLGIGAQRSGTTWLTGNLRRHPEIWVPPKKEIHYFDRAMSYPTPSLLASSSIFVKLLSRRKSGRQWREALKSEIRKNAKNPDWPEMSWYLRFFFGRYDDRWYASLFREAKGRVKGEVTPSYSVLEPKDIEYIQAIMPKIRIIYLIRNPIDRAWSAIRYRKLKKKAGRSLNSLSLDDLKRIVEREAMSLRGDYVRTINNWKSYFPDDQIFIGFFEDIVEAPELLLREVFQFLGVDASDEYITRLAFKKSNPSPSKRMPPELRLYLAEKYYSRIKTLSEILGRYANNWLEEVEDLLQEKR